MGGAGDPAQATLKVQYLSESCHLGSVVRNWSYLGTK